MGGTHGLALATTQTIFDAVGNGAYVGLLHDERLVAHQAKAGGVGLAQAGVTHARLRCIVAQQFALVKTPFRVDALFIVSKGLQLGVCQKL